MKTRHLSFLALSALLAGAISANAATINVNFGVAKTEADLFGPVGSIGETWNQAGTGTFDTDLSDSAGAVTTIDWAFSGSSFTGNGNWNSATTIEMLESAFFQSDGNTRTLTLSGLDAGKTYDLYIGSFDQNSWTNAPMSFSTTNTTTTVGPQVASNTLGTPWTLDNNYVLFEGLVANGSDEIAISGVKVSGDHGMWNGFQLVEVIPEPGTAALMGFGALTLMRRRRS